MTRVKPITRRLFTATVSVCVMGVLNSALSKFPGPGTAGSRILTLPTSSLASFILRSCNFVPFDEGLPSLLKAE